jgi:C-terminal processing protease CtpA/Prc
MQFLPPINVGDTLVTVGGKNVYGLSLTTLRTIVPGPAGSTVNLGFQSEMGARVEAPLRRTTGIS